MHALGWTALAQGCREPKAARRRQYGMRFFPWSVIATVLATLLPAGLLVGPSAAAAATEGASPWHTTFVEYGDGPTRFQHGRRFKITFDGGAGDRVRVGPQDHWSSGPCGARLVRDGSPVDTYDSLTRFWTLPARDRYTFKVVNCGDDIDRLRSVQLLKLRTHRVVGESLRLVRQTGYVDAAVVRTPDSGPPVIVSALARKTSKTWVPGAVVDLDTHQGAPFRAARLSRRRRPSHRHPRHDRRTRSAPALPPRVLRRRRRCRLRGADKCSGEPPPADRAAGPEDRADLGRGHSRVGRPRSRSALARCRPPCTVGPAR